MPTLDIPEAAVRFSATSNAADLRQLLSYNPGTGVFTWLVALRLGKPAGDVAGTLGADGYISISILRRKYKAHRLAWLYLHGEWPKDEIDHINGDRADNRLANLRPATRHKNSANKRRYSNNQSGRKGVNWHRQHQKWCTRITVNGKRKHIGLFHSLEDAADAYRRAAIENFGEFARIS